MEKEVFSAIVGASRMHDAQFWRETILFTYIHTYILFLYKENIYTVHQLNKCRCNASIQLHWNRKRTLFFSSLIESQGANRDPLERLVYPINSVYAQFHLLVQHLNVNRYIHCLSSFLVYVKHTCPCTVIDTLFDSTFFKTSLQLPSSEIAVSISWFFFYFRKLI